MGAKHTPGPWDAPSSQSFYVRAGSEVICNASTRANAVAISALPDLLAFATRATDALEAIRRSRGESVWPGQQEAMDELVRLLSSGRAAIAKARPSRGEK